MATFTFFVQLDKLQEIAPGGYIINKNGVFRKRSFLKKHVFFYSRISVKNVFFLNILKSWVKIQNFAEKNPLFLHWLHTPHKLKTRKNLKTTKHPWFLSMDLLTFYWRAYKLLGVDIMNSTRAQFYQHLRT
jgi:hypothetical protein